MPAPLSQLRQETQTLGKPAWRPMLAYVAELHERSIRPVCRPFPHAWEEIGPGYCYGPAFGHWDIVHQVLDVLPAEPEHARLQLLNTLSFQDADGALPGVIWMRDPEKPRWSMEVTHPPVWPVAVDEWAARQGNSGFQIDCLAHLERLIGWFERQRAAQSEGFYYADILTHKWESGVDEGVRFLDVQTGPFACIDATAHVYLLYETAARWRALAQRDAAPFQAKAGALRRFIQALFCEETGFFHDQWSVNEPGLRRLSFEGMWPVVVGAATPEQARRVVYDNLLHPERFFLAHPIATVARSDPAFELRMWRGPAWNSMTFWAARGCQRYGFRDAAKALLERALDDSAAQFERTGTIWEFYNSLGGRQEDVKRKPHTQFNQPCRDYLGHNPLIAMARLYMKI